MKKESFLLKSSGRYRISFAVFIVSTMIFLAIMGLGVQTDIQTHIVKNSYPNDPPSVISNFLFYWLIWCLSFLLRSKILTGATVALILGLAVMWKYQISRNILLKEARQSQWETLSNGWFLFSSIGLVIAFSLPVSAELTNYYLGQFPANIWHNSTTIAVMPFVVLAFYECCKYLINPNLRGMLLITIWSFFIYIIKPSMLPVYAVVLPVFAFLKNGLRREFFLTLVYGAVVVVILFIPLLFVIEGSNGRNNGGLEIGLFKVWSLYSDNFVGSLISSLFFPLLCVLFYLRESVKNLYLMFGWGCWFCAFLMFSVIHETGDFMKAGNFGWQLIMATYLLFLASLIFLNEKMSTNKVDLKVKLIGTVFVFHVLSGVVYLIKMYFFGYF